MRLFDSMIDRLFRFCNTKNLFSSILLPKCTSLKWPIGHIQHISDVANSEIHDQSDYHKKRSGNLSRSTSISKKINSIFGPKSILKAFSLCFNKTDILFLESTEKNAF